MTGLAWLAEAVAAMLAFAKDLANVRYLYKASPEEVAINKQDNRAKTMSERVAARLERWKVKHK